MSKEEGERRLAAILSADVADYSNLMGDDERATVRTLTDYRKVFIDHIERHNGRVVDTAGDSVLSVLDSVVEAVQCAVNIQTELATRNSALAENRRMHFRIGINLGDVIEQDDGTIYGHGVNIAARLESLAQPGGITVSGTVFDHAENKLPVAFEFTGEKAVKNITKPVRAYRVIAENAPAVSSGGDKPHTLPNKPSIAVLPFENLSGDASQEFFVDGLTESLITTLTKASGLFVIARSSMFTYKGKGVNVQHVTADLGVSYVLEGSVQRMGNRVRINAQLVDGRTRHQIWAERYDRDVDDLFVLQDEITLNILTACQVSLTEGEQARMIVGSSRHVNLAAIELYWQAVASHRKFTKTDNAAARVLLERCIEMDGEDASRLCYLGLAHIVDVRSGWAAHTARSLEQAHELALRAEELQGPSGLSKLVLANVANLRGQHDEAVKLGRLAVDLEPSYADAWFGLGILLNYVGQPRQAMDAIGRAMQLSPYYPVGYLYALGVSRFLAGLDREAVAAFENCIKRKPDSRSNYVWLAIVHVVAGRLPDGQACAQRAMQLDPYLTIEKWVNTEAFKDKATLQCINDAMEVAGFPRC